MSRAWTITNIWAYSMRSASSMPGVTGLIIGRRPGIAPIPCCRRPWRSVRSLPSQCATEAERGCGRSLLHPVLDPKLGRRDVSLRCPCLDALGGEADIARAPEAGFLLCIHGIGLMAGTIGLEI